MAILESPIVHDSHLILNLRSTMTPHTQCEGNIVDSKDPHPQCLYEPRGLLSLPEWAIKSIDEVKCATLQ
jgi:hypothetical protein